MTGEGGMTDKGAVLGSLWWGDCVTERESALLCVILSRRI